ncbi:hypothetical protein C5469_01645 [Photorhabdus cinerea]|uniref:Uncharacterized protein n=1 Tax=Photorhabdus cinerea TaxID=471575 RepID=A0A7X5QAQ7_9GAMM|nr:hypothetical protein [Photorhabdus cinerea]
MQINALANLTVISLPSETLLYVLQVKQLPSEKLKNLSNILQTQTAYYSAITKSHWRYPQFH